MDIAQKMDLADHILWNEGAPELLMDQMKEILSAEKEQMVVMGIVVVAVLLLLNLRSQTRSRSSMKQPWWERCYG